MTAKDKQQEIIANLRENQKGIKSFCDVLVANAPPCFSYKGRMPDDLYGELIDGLEITLDEVENLNRECGELNRTADVAGQALRIAAKEAGAATLAEIMIRSLGWMEQARNELRESD